MIQLYTGDGKGKTTAAIGQAVRAAGCGKKVILSQFMKGNDTGELHVLCDMENIEIIRSDKNFGFYSQMSEEDKRNITDIHNNILNSLITAAMCGDTFMIVMDELTYPVNWGLIDTEKVKHLITLAQNNENEAPEIELVITGRDAADFLVEAADYITEMKCVRHPYDRGIKARAGIEF